MKLSGVPDSVKTNGDAAVPSTPVQPDLRIGVSSGDANSGKPKDGTAASPGPVKPVVQNGVSSGVRIGVRGKASVSSAAKDKAIVSDNSVGKEITFKDVTFGPHEGEVRFRLIHFWEAWNVRSKTLIGLEMLLIDEEETVIQGFIPQGRIEVYLRHLKAGDLYRLNKFFGSKSKPIYRVAEPDVTICFSWNSVLSLIEESSIRFPEDRFRIHGYKEFDAACELRGDLYDYVGHIKLVNGQVPNESLLLDEAEIAASCRVDLHVQTYEYVFLYISLYSHHVLSYSMRLFSFSDHVLKVGLWDKAAFEFCEKFNASEGTAHVILVTTLNPKRFGGLFLSLSSMAPSRVFLDNDVEETRVYLNWLNSNLDVASRVNVEAAWFECTATIDAVVHGSEWYYIGCAVCHTKANRGPTTLMCKKCEKAEIVGVAHYLSRLSVYDHIDQAVFVLLGDAGEELTGKKAGELVESYYQANEGVEGDHIVPVPQAMMYTIGQTRKFVVKVDEEPESESEDHAEESVKRGADVIVPEGVKNAKCG
ncbi:hypothetical protein Bca52824_062968 [Brassica carinata]|uniref:Replication factor A C-terminal domain-containing protein n=1 Tax=Brassica carinata TaxID=52824 RepID=A0A8X7QI14_BRACI|nr:hypothetical protein Bca52824_062968 [Brassica carinata]